MKAVGQALKLRPGCYDEYKKRHDELWPELADVMRSHGVNMAIYRFEDTLFNMVPPRRQKRGKRSPLIR